MKSIQDASKKYELTICWKQNDFMFVTYLVQTMQQTVDTVDELITWQTEVEAEGKDG